MNRGDLYLIYYEDSEDNFLIAEILNTTTNAISYHVIFTTLPVNVAAYPPVMFVSRFGFINWNTVLLYTET